MAGMKRTIACIVVVAAVVFVVWHCNKTEVSDRTQAGTKRPAAAVHAGRTVEVSDDRPPPAWFAPRHVSPRRIAGRVTFRNAPVKDAVVSLHSMLTRAKASPPLVIRTAADGAFDFGVRPAGEYDVTATSSGMIPAAVHIDLADPTLKPVPNKLELRLRECHAAVEGTVYDASGNRLPNVHVRLNGLDGAESDARGEYRLCVPWGESEIIYDGDGLGSVLLTLDVRGLLRRDVVLVPEATLAVIVVRSDSGAVVPDAHVLLVPREWGLERAANASGVTDREGRVQVGGLLPGRYRAWAFAENLRLHEPVEVLTQVGAANEVTLRLDATAQISGKVVQRGEPVAGAQIVAVRKSPVGRSARGVSQADGSFTLDGVPAGDLLFTAAPYEVDSPKLIKTEPGKVYQNIVVEVHRLGAIRGHVTRLGKPVAGAEICCISNGREPKAITNDEGLYEFRGLPASTYSLAAFAGELGAASRTKTFALKTGEEGVLDFELDMAGMISGVVVDQSGDPVPGVFVRWLNERTAARCFSSTDAKGRYRCGGLADGGTYRAAVFASPEQHAMYPTADGAAYPVAELKDSNTTLQNVAISIDRPQLAISGRVIDDAGAPVADAIVKALAASGGDAAFQPWLQLPVTSTDEGGSFTFTSLVAGTYALRAQAADGQGTSPLVEAGSTNVIIRIERPATIAGTLVGFTQPPAVTARTLTELNVVPGTVEGGQFRITGLRPGKYLVSAQSGYEGDALMLEARGGQVVTTVLTSRGQGTIHGAVLDFHTRTPIVNAVCHAMMAVDGEHVPTRWDPGTASKSDASGRIVLERAPAGSVTVRCEMPSLKRSRPSTDVRLSPGGQAHIELLSTERTRESEGTVGVMFSPYTTPPRVFGVQPNSPAANAGVQVGDLITHVNSDSTEGLNGAGVRNLLGNVAPGEQIRLTVVRSGAQKSFMLKVAAGL